MPSAKKLVIRKISEMIPISEYVINSISTYPILKKMDADVLTELINEIKTVDDKLIQNYDDQKLKKFVEFLESDYHDDLEIEEITSASISECYDVESLEIETSDNQEYQIIFDDSEMEDNIRSELLQDSEYEYMYCEGIKAENINPVSTPFTDWIDEIINYDGIGSIISSYDGELNELNGNSVWFRRN